MTNTVSIRKESWPEVADTPHFIVDLRYEGCGFNYDDIYFDELPTIVSKLVALEQSRKGEVLIDGGSRFSVTLVMNARGSLDFIFRTESDISFPGRLTLEGSFLIEGEYTGSCLLGLIRLFERGADFAI